MSVARRSNCEKCGRHCIVIFSPIDRPEPPQICDPCIERMKCKNCGTMPSPEHVFCGNCGERLKTPMWYVLLIAPVLAILALLLAVLFVGKKK